MVDIFFFEFKKHLGFSMEPEIESVFSCIRDYLNSSEAAMHRDRLNPSKIRRRNWFRELQNSIGYCQSQLGSVIYHFENLKYYEKLSIDLIRKHKPMDSAAPGQAIALSAEKLDYEFQAFSIGLKIYLSMVATTVFVFFKTENHSFNGYIKNLNEKQPIEISKRVINFLNEQWNKLSTFYSIEDRRSVRDVMVHYKYLGAGWINIYSGIKVGELVAGMAIPEEILRNETLKPEFSPNKVESIGLGVTKLVYGQLSFVLTLSVELFKLIEIYKPLAEPSN